MTILVGYLADRANQRGVFNMATSLLGVVGFAMLLLASSTGRPAVVAYAAVFLAAMGIYPCVPNTVTWVANNVEGVYKRGVTLGFVIGL